jgi:ribonuclease HI
MAGPDYASNVQGHATVWFDGASRGNPGLMAGGAVVDVDGRRVVLHGHVRKGTNNEAEYEGLLLGLRHALDADATTVEVRGDSQLVIRQLEGIYQVRAPNLKPLHREARSLLSRFRARRLVWVPREQNHDADEAANRALDG